MKSGEPAPVELFIWNVIMRTGWSYEYVESMSMERRNEYIQVVDAVSKARASE